MSEIKKDNVQENAVNEAASNFIHNMIIFSCTCILFREFCNHVRKKDSPAGEPFDFQSDSIRPSRSHIRARPDRSSRHDQGSCATRTPAWSW